ncbi:DUF6483 family protein [Scatolibacter rhodanostii]|uniref:DUF6483 family protein n=1 Tax=Scatolibacter rhodanostii TaxID=2014781 RepID=UPI000C089F66|nr:DUF6483 family protein [Scatolibacter rhodanostii]
MVYEKDWVMRQILQSVDTLARIVFQKGADKQEEFQNVDSTDLNLRIKSLLYEKRYGEAENILFESMTLGDKAVLRQALDFYISLNEKSEEELKEGNFSHEEIQQGIQDIAKKYGIDGVLLD